MKSKVSTTMVAACAASVSSPCAANHFDAVLPQHLSQASVADVALHRLDNNIMMQATVLLLDRIPRGGGYTPPTTSVDSKKKRKKKKGTKPNQNDTNKKADSSSSSSPPTSFKQQPADSDGNSTANNTESNDNDPTTPPQFHTSGNKAPSAHPNNVHQNEETLPPAVQSILEQTCHYDVLGITKAASQIEIQKAYRRRCKLTHPDKLRGGERTAFDKVSEAYEVLSCEKKRAVYDRFGKEGLEKGISTSINGMDFRFGTAAGTSFFGNDLFREFFGQQQQQSTSSTNAFRWAQPQPPTPPRNRDLRYQLEVTLEELYNGSTKHVAIQQPNPERPYFPYRKELEVSLPLFTRRGHDLAMEVRISFSEAIVGYRRQITCLDGRTIVIGSPYVRKVVQKTELVDVPSLPSEKIMDDDSLVNDLANNSGTDIVAGHESPIVVPSEQRATKTTIFSYDLPPSILKTGDVHVLKGYGMPKRRGGHHDAEYGDLYIQYVVEMPLASSASSSTSSSVTSVNAENLSPVERVELARLLCKLEGRKDDPARDIVHSSGVHATVGAESISEGVGKNDLVHYLSFASASDFGQSNTAYDDNNDHDEHLRHDDDNEDVGGHGMHHHQDVSDFFRRAFTAGRSSSPFGFGGTASGGGGGGGGVGGFHYFSSGSRGRGYGGDDEEDHKVECNQM